MTESIILPEPFAEDFCMLDIIAEKIHSNASSMSLSLKIISAFELNKNYQTLFYLRFLSF